MNDRIRSILHTAWDEPRHFFFWLAMLSICGFATTTSIAALAGATMLLAFIALSCVLCFVVSIPALILAWIPPVRRLFSWLLRRRFLVLGCLVTLVALFYAIEDWRGRRAWQDYKHAWEAKGERFDWAGIAPPPVPNDQNFFETPLWTDLHLVETNRGRAWGDEDGQEHILFSVSGPKGQNAPSIGSWIKAQPMDLAAWQGFYRGNSNQVSEAVQVALKPKSAEAAVEAFRKRYGLGSDGTRKSPENSPPTNYFPVAKEPRTPAADVLLALSRFDENRKLLITAAARPQDRFWVNYDAGFAVMVPHLSRLKACSQYLSLHATAALKAGDRETALEDVKLLFRLIESIRREPVLISYLVRVALVQIALQPVWEGLADRQWTAADLSVIENELGKQDFLNDYPVAMRGERACNLWGMDYIRQSGFAGLDEMVAPGRHSGPLDLGEFTGRAAFQLIPAGWFDQNKLSISRMHEKYLLPLAGGQDRGVVRPAAVKEANLAFEQQGRGPYNIFLRMLLPSLSGLASKAARAQCSIDLARVACALERYRLANSQFPEVLTALAPKFIEALPQDVINGQPLKYHRTNDGQFVLNSVGWNETDDGGTIALTKKGGVDWNQGDWVWRYPAK